MRRLVIVALLAVLSACAASPAPVVAPSPLPDDPAAPVAATTYRPVMAGTVYHGQGRTP